MRDLLDFYTIARPGWPPLNMVVYNTLLIGCCAFALWRGGPPEKIGFIVLTVASFLTFGVASDSATFQSVEAGIFVVDLLCLIAFLGLALQADRFWPLWVAALQLIGTAGHAARFVDPDIVDRTYAFMLAVWAYPMILLMFIGTLRHRQRMARFGADRSWSNFGW